MPRLSLRALLWIPLGVPGWVSGIFFLTPVFILWEDGILYWIIPFACYALAVPPAALLLEKGKPATAVWTDRNGARARQGQHAVLPPGLKRGRVARLASP